MYYEFVPSCWYICANYNINFCTCQYTLFVPPKIDKHTIIMVQTYRYSGTTKNLKTPLNTCLSLLFYFFCSLLITKPHRGALLLLKNSPVYTGLSSLQRKKISIVPYLDFVLVGAILGLADELACGAVRFLP